MAPVSSCKLENTMSFQIDSRTLRSFIRDGFLPPDDLVEYGLEQGILLQVIPDLTANRMWIHHGGTFVAIAVCLRNDGEHDQIVDECFVEIPWAPQVEILSQTEKPFTEIFVAGGEEFSRSSVLNQNLPGALLRKSGGSMEGIVIFRVYGRPSQQEVSPTMPLQLRVDYASGLQSVGSGKVRFDSWRELAGNQRGASAPAPRRIHVADEQPRKRFPKDREAR
jgi:hypothetical protein